MGVFMTTDKKFKIKITATLIMIMVGMLGGIQAANTADDIAQRLFEAARSKNSAAVKKLCGQGANVVVCDAMGRTPLHIGRPA